MNYEGYIIYRWEELTDKIIEKQWLIDNNIEIYTLEIYNIKPRRIIYGLTCQFYSKIGKVYINNDSKNVVQTAFTKILQNNIKLEYFIGLSSNIDYYNFYTQYNPDNPNNNNLESDYTNTDVPDSLDINYDDDSN